MIVSYKTFANRGDRALNPHHKPSPCLPCFPGTLPQLPELFSPHPSSSLILSWRWSVTLGLGPSWGVRIPAFLPRVYMLMNLFVFLLFIYLLLWGGKRVSAKNSEGEREHDCFLPPLSRPIRPLQDCSPAGFLHIL